MFCPECGELALDSDSSGNIKCGNYRCAYEGPSGGVLVETEDGIRNFGGPPIPLYKALDLEITYKFRCPMCLAKQEKKWYGRDYLRPGSELPSPDKEYIELDNFWYIHHCEEWPKWQQHMPLRIPTHSAMIEDTSEIHPPSGIIARILAVIGKGRSAEEKQYQRSFRTSYSIEIELLISSYELTFHSEKIVKETERFIPRFNEIPMSKPKSLRHLTEVIPEERGAKKGVSGPPCPCGGSTVSTSAFTRGMGRPPVHHYHCTSCGKKWTERD